MPLTSCHIHPIKLIPSIAASRRFRKNQRKLACSQGVHVVNRSSEKSFTRQLSHCFLVRFGEGYAERAWLCGRAVGDNGMPMSIAKFEHVCFEAWEVAKIRKDFLPQVPVFFQKAAVFFREVALDDEKVALDDEKVTFDEQRKALPNGETSFAKADAPIERRIKKSFTVSSLLLAQ